MVTQVDPEAFFASLDSELEQQSLPQTPALPQAPAEINKKVVVLHEREDKVVMLILGGMLIIGLVSIVMTLSKRG